MKTLSNILFTGLLVSLAYGARAELAYPLFVKMNPKTEALAKTAIKSANSFLSSYKEASKNSFFFEEVQKETLEAAKELINRSPALRNDGPALPQKEVLPSEPFPSEGTFKRAHLLFGTKGDLFRPVLRKNEVAKELSEEEEEPNIAKALEEINKKVSEFLQASLEKHNPYLVRDYKAFYSNEQELSKALKGDLKFFASKVDSAEEFENLLDRVDALSSQLESLKLSNEEAYLQVSAARTLLSFFKDIDSFKTEEYIYSVDALAASVYKQIKIPRIVGTVSNYSRMSHPPRISALN